MAADRFGREITRIRRIAGITQYRLARMVGVSSSHLSNIERGVRMPTPSLVGALDHALDEDGRLIRAWEDLTGTGRPAWLIELADVERDAMSIMEFQLALFPSLIQIEDYARTIIQTISPWLPRDEVEQSVRARMGRAERFVEADAPLMHIVLDRSVLASRTNEPGVMRTQLAHTFALACEGRISLQFVEGQHPGLAGSFKIISARHAPDVVYAESSHSGQVVDDPEEVQQFRVRMASLQATAASPAESLRVLQGELEGLDDE